MALIRGARAGANASKSMGRSRRRTWLPPPRRGAAASGASGAAGLRGRVGLASFGYKKGFNEHPPPEASVRGEVAAPSPGAFHSDGTIRMVAIKSRAGFIWGSTYAK